MKSSVITVCFNSVDTIEDTIRSVLSQAHGDLEYIIVDGGSTDGTLEVIAKYRDRIARCISEPDDGIYDAMNKGIRAATGQIIGCLNADDMYADDKVISEISAMAEKQGAHGVYGDLLYVHRDDCSKVVRYWRAGPYLPGAFRHGWVPPHPTFFCRKDVLEEFGYFDDLYRIAGDFELMLRLIEKHRIRLGYIPRPLVRMRAGGRANTVRGIVRGNREILHAFAENGVRPSMRFLWNRPFTRIGQLVKRPKRRSVSKVTEDLSRT